MRKISTFLLLIILFITACGGSAIEPALPTRSATAVPIAQQPTPTLANTPTPLPAPTDTAVPTDTPVPTATAVPTAVPTATPTTTPIPPTATPAPDTAALQQELQDLAFNALPTPTSGNAFDTFTAITAFPLSDNLWAAYTTGLRSFDPLQNHFIAIYTRQNDTWQELSRLELESPDYMFEGGVERVELGDGRYWFQVNSGVGAHGNCYDLARYDGVTFTQVLDHCTSSLASEGVQDINGDGNPDLVLNFTVDYVFCYACSVRLPIFQVLTFDGSDFVEVNLSPAPADLPADVLAANDEAINDANFGLWQDAEMLINGIQSDNPTVNWNRTIINLHATALRQGIERAIYPLLEYLFYGDYAATLDVLRPFPPDQLFATADTNPLIAGTVAEGWTDAVVEYVTTYTNEALAAKPDLAAAYFLRGWVQYLVTPGGTPAAQDDITTARTLDPNEPLYQLAISNEQ